MTRVVLGLLILMSFLFVESSYALDVEQIYGESSPEFIHQYNERLLGWFLQRNPDLKKCISEQDQKSITKAIRAWKRWGEVLKSPQGQGRQNMLNFEVFYQKQGPKLYSGIRFRWPRDKSYTFQNKKWNEEYWGIEVTSDACQSKTLRHVNSATSSSLVNDQGERLELTLHSGVQRDYYFGALVKNSIPIFKENKLVAEVLYLDSYNLLFFSPDFSAIAVAHEKEFHQLALRFKWKAQDEYTVYYP